MRRFETMNGETVLISRPKHWKNYILPALSLLTCLIFASARWAYRSHTILELFPAITATESGRMIFESVFGIKGLLVLVEMAVVTMMSLQALVTVIDISATRYYVTDKRVVATSGLLNVRICEILIKRIETVELNESVYERIFGSGDILIIAAGTNIYLDDVYDAREFKMTLVKQMSEEL